MNIRSFPLALACLLLSASSRADRLTQAERYARRCQSHATDRNTTPSGTLLWGTKRTWDESQQRTDERRSVLVSIDISSQRIPDAQVQSLELRKGRLIASPVPSASLVGAVLQGSASDGKPVEVALCGAEPAPEDSDMVWYRIEAWNPVAQAWENPCVATGRVPDPRAMPVSGVWDSTGTHQQVKGKLTLACENGVISKCIRWGYKPWASRDGQSLADLHQACTRMARADYCGNGRSHTSQDTVIDMYDRLGVRLSTTTASASWDPERASFEAAWATDGATCLSHMRDGRALETLLRECPGRFHIGAPVDLGHGDRCTVQRADMSPELALLKNRSYGPGKIVTTSSQAAEPAGRVPLLGAVP
ncbi:MAG TPA: ADYC domain-containing protein [Hyalangium sp.]|jgi:hypothetical protein|nr:ADYC domain-containing protein [Hyalangium sp.]